MYPRRFRALMRYRRWLIEYNGSFPPYGESLGKIKPQIHPDSEIFAKPGYYCWILPLFFPENTSKCL